MDMFHGHMVLSVQKDGVPLFCSVSMPIDVIQKKPIKIEELNPWFFPVPSRLCNVAPGSNQDFMSSIYRVVISSPVDLQYMHTPVVEFVSCNCTSETRASNMIIIFREEFQTLKQTKQSMPDVMVDYDMAKRKFTILHQEEVVGLSNDAKENVCVENFHSNFSGTRFHGDRHLQSVEDSKKLHDISEAFSCERKEVISHDGVRIPLTILYSKSSNFTGQSPGVLHGYGAYGEVLDKSWSSDLLCLLCRGWVFAYADVRGGGGNSSWHQAGTGSDKLNSMYDFAACGSYLISEGYVHKNQLCAIGTSAGGLLVGACINMYPDLFSAAVLKVPFLDICNTMLDPTLPLTMLDYEEFGDPRHQTEFETIQRYSPYDNIPSGMCYPSVLVTASFYDSRVGVWEAAKWVARVRESTCPTCSRSVILKTNMSGGHFGEGGRFMRCEETAFEYAFLIKVTGMLDDEIGSN